MAGGRDIALQVTGQAEDALGEHTSRRVWLGFSLLLIIGVIVLLNRFIKTLPPPELASAEDGPAS